MKKKILTIMLTMLALLACAFALFACGRGNANGGIGNIDGNTDNDNGGGDSTNNDAVVIGTYYLDNNGKPDDSLYYVFRNNKWTDADDLTGRYAVSGNKVTLYIEVFGEDEVFDSGTVVGNKITMSDGLVFCKGEDLTSKPKRLSYELSDDEKYYKVTGIGTMDGDVVVPETYRTMPVTEIDYRAFQKCTKLTGIEIPESVTILGVQAFENCTNLVTAKINGKITELPEAVFGGCTKLVDLHIPDTVEEINYKAFVGCEKVQNVYYGGTVSDWAQIKFGISASHAGNRREEPYWANPISGSGRRLIIDDATVTSCKLKQVNDGAFFQYKYLTSVEAEAIGDYAFYNSSITSLTAYSVGTSACEGCHELKSFSGGGSIIGKNAFYDCTAMTTVSLGKSVVEIGESAFSYCDRLTSIEIPSSVIYIGQYAFAGNDMEEIIFGAADYWAIDSNGELQEISQDLTNKMIAARLLTQRESNNGYSGYVWKVQPIVYTLNKDNNSYSLTRVTRGFVDADFSIPEKYNNKPITSVANEAFKDCKKLINVTVPNSVTSIGSSAFSGCSSLASITIPNSVTSIGGYAFSGCWSLTSITIPNSVTSIGGYAFSGCSRLTSVTIPNGVTYISEYAFEKCSRLTSVTIPNSVTDIGQGVFADCSSLMSATIGSGVTSIGSGVFDRCNNLANITVASDNSEYSSQDGILYNKSKTELIFAPRGIKEHITIPETTTSIWAMAFYGCSRLTSIEIPNSVTSIGQGAFDYTGYYYDESNWENGILYIGKYLIKAKDTISGQPNIKQGTRVIADYAFYNCESLQSIEIPNSVISIGNCAFYSCHSLINVWIANGVTSIGERTFLGCIRLGNISIPESVTSIGEHAFDACHGLSNIKIHSRMTSIGSCAFRSTAYYEDESNWENGVLYIGKHLIEANDTISGVYEIKQGTLTIAEGAFSGCRSLTSVEIPNSVTSIGRWAFSGCYSLTSIEIPNSVTSIGRWAFSGCSSYRFTIYCEATSEPSGWDSLWNPDLCKVVWGHKI